jgi:NADPH:quinone reductase-like Zn-dependent oxidoreductase
MADPVAGPLEAVVAVEACGVNRLDLWLEQGGLPMTVQLPRTPGGEIAGRVAAVGRDVRGWHVGERVAVQSNLFCGRCEFCARGDESLCLHGELLGVHRDGGFAERVLVPAAALVPLPDAVDAIGAAALTLAGSTAMHMLTNRAQVAPGAWVLVLAGASGVGSAAIQIAARLGARVISTGSSDAKRRLAQSLGAEAVFDTGDPEWPAKVRALTGKRGVDLMIEHVGGSVLEQAFACLARGGTIVTCGATAGRIVSMDLWPFFVKQQTLVGSYGRSRADIEATLAWAADGRLRPVVDRVYSLEQIPEALARLRGLEALGKLIVVPNA